ncbi:MAG TPA: hypothetical protein VGB08_01775 [Allosphingosinicella sp.]|jgi:hypothetical protein
MRLLLGLAALAASLWPAASRACSLVPDFIPASNFELVQMADAIVVAAALRSERGPDRIRQVIFRTQSALKGAPPPEFALPDTRLGRTRRSDNEDLSTVNAEAYSGMCNRGTFARGARYLLFLERGEDGAWRQVGMPFSRINEDYTGERSSWTRTVRRYLSLQQGLAPMEQIAALTRMAETGRGPDGRPLTPTEREDAAAHLGGVSPWKPTPWLLDVYARAERGEPIPFMAPQPAAAEHAGDPVSPPPEGSAAAALDSVLAAMDGPYQRASERRLDPIRDRVLQSLVEGRHPDALPLFERLWASPQTARPLRGLILRYFAGNGLYSRAYRWIEGNLLTELEALPRGDAEVLLRDVATVQTGASWEEGRERCRSDALAAATWPALSRAIHEWQLRTFGAGRANPFFARETDRR